MDFICAKCNTVLKKSSDLLISGCTNCGSKVFKTISPPPPNETRNTQVSSEKELSTPHYEIIPKMWEETEEDNLASIRLRKKGIYEVNIDSLFRSKRSDPIILSGKKGVYKIELLSKKRK